MLIVEIQHFSLYSMTNLSVPGLDRVESLESSGGLELEGVGGGDTQRPLQAAHPQWTLSIGRGQLQPPLLARPGGKV